VLGSPVLGSLGLRQNALHAFDDNNEHNDAAGAAGHADAAVNATIKTAAWMPMARGALARLRLTYKLHDYYQG